MMSLKESFFTYLGQTSPYPIGLEIDHADGCFVFDQEGNKYYDLISGFSVSNTGHSNPEIIEAITAQARKYMHTMVYGEYIQAPQVEYAKALIDSLPQGSFDQVFFTNSGAEAVEGALKLAKRHTGKHELICFRNAYHGSTHGALSVMGSEIYKTAFRPLLPSVRILDFNDFTQLDQISSNSAAVIVEPCQAEAGIIPAVPGFLTALRARCDATGSLLLFDEIQTGFGRTGELFAFMHEKVIPDILILAKALGGGMPLGAFIAPGKIMSAFTHDPVLGHLTTFGGHPVSCAAGLASFTIINRDRLAEKSRRHEEFIRKNLRHNGILEIRGQGLLLALVMDSAERVDQFFRISLEQGLLFDYFLFCREAIRVAPPLTISDMELSDLCQRIIETLDKTEALPI